MMMVEGVKVDYPFEMTPEEAVRYAEEEIGLWREKGKTLDTVEIQTDGGYVIVKAKEKSPIRRVRRITGYLSELHNFNDAKQAELEERTRHELLTM
ncbi:MAG: anaerobic ribonucleoside-triphosphate reductase [Negativicutes bacterium]|nr:anaerobic ribonucleoside-triphosphate reductase [Negativicutes bacterium]